jgi:uncharacterized protein YdhG (YjbR/CyaY superfamily)
MADTKKTTKGASRTDEVSGWTEQEVAAMQERAREVGKGKRGAAKPDGEADVAAKIADMPEPDRSMAKRIHEIVKTNGPSLTVRTYYGMPAYAKDGKVLCFFQPASKFKARYATIGFDEAANLDEGTMWPTSWALTKLTAADEKRIADLVKQAVS